MTLERMFSLKKKLTIAGLSVLGLGAAYLGGIGYYSERFTPNTEYKSVDISNLTLEEANEHIAKEISNQEFKLVENGEEVATVKIADLDPTFDAKSDLEQVYYSQNPNNWLASIVSNTVSAQGEDAEVIKIDTQAVADEINEQGDREAAVDASIAYDEEQGYHAVEGESGTLIDPELLEEELVEQIETGSESVEIEEAYDQPDITVESDEIQDTLQQIDSVINTDLTIEIAGDTIELDPQQIEDWLHFDGNNNMVLDSEGVSAFLTEIDAEYSTFGKTRSFESTLQGTVEVPPGILGWGIDIEQATTDLSAAILSGESGTHQLATYSTGGNAGAADEIGDSYVEIDLSNQMMFLYHEGELILSTEMVSGQPGAETVPGANAVNEMLTDTNLVGYNQFSDVEYSTPVSYWIRFDDQAQGIHDAPWQSTYGGNTWQYAGSLGCINTPYGAAATIYEYVNIGTPVMVFY